MAKPKANAASKSTAVATKTPKKATSKTVAATSARSAKKPALPQTIGVGIIGAGGIARGVHIPGYQKLENVEVVAVADPVAASRDAAIELGVATAFADYREMLERDDIQVISVTTPNFMHAEATIAALEAGKHVLCEKPLAMNTQEGEAMVEAARRTGNNLMCGFHYRFTPEVQCLKKFAAAGSFGDMYYTRVQALRRRGIPGWGLFINKEKNGGGPLIDIGVHMLDSAMHVLGYPKVVAVSGQTYQKFGKRGDVVGLFGQWDYKNFTVEDLASAYVRFENGATLVLESSFVAEMEESEKMGFQIFGDKGGAEYNSNSGSLKMFREEHMTLLDLTPKFLPKGVQAHHAQIASFVESVRNDTPVFTPGEEALSITRIIEAIYQSSEAGREIRLDG